MNNYKHYVTGIFASNTEATQTLSEVIKQGIPSNRLHIYTKSDLKNPVKTDIESDETLKEMLVDGAIGTGIGTGVGALTSVALIAANVSLFIASPLLAPLVILGWGASLGGLVGATIGASNTVPENKNAWFSDLILDAISNDQFVLVVETQSAEETEMSRKVIKESVGELEEKTVLF